MSEIHGRIALLKAAAGLAAASFLVSFAGLVAYGAAQAHTPSGQTRLSEPVQLFAGDLNPADLAGMSNEALKSLMAESQRVLGGLVLPERSALVVETELNRLRASARSSSKLALALANELNDALAWECLASRIAAIEAEQVRRRLI